MSADAGHTGLWNSAGSFLKEFSKFKTNQYYQGLYDVQGTDLRILKKPTFNQVIDAANQFLVRVRDSQSAFISYMDTYKAVDIGRTTNPVRYDTTQFDFLFRRNDFFKSRSEYIKR